MIDAIATTHRLLARSELSTDEVAAMHDLLDMHFQGVSRDQFIRDLGEKNWVILVERNGRIVGFSTLLAYQTTYEGEELAVIYSGDTIVAREAWNTSALPRGWIESVAALRAHYPRGSYFWLLLTSGFRTYRHLPLFWREYYPCVHMPTPRSRQQVLDHLAAERFGARYDRTEGIVRLRHPQTLRQNLAEIPLGRATNPHIAFFAERNRGHSRGDELVCLTELDPANLTRAGRRMASAVATW